jgi:hypothetical protein
MAEQMKPWAKSLLTAAGLGVLYGTLAQFFMRTLSNVNEKIFSSGSFMIMTIGFVFFLPFAIGMLHVFLRQRDGMRSFAQSIFEPMMPASICLMLSLLIGWEGTICLIMAFPIVLVLSGLGGLAMRLILNSQQKNLIFVAFMVLPMPLSLLEQSIDSPQEKRVVTNTIRINATAQTVWKKIVRVEKITEPQESVFFALGFPRPIEAVLSGDGIGQTRLATFERGLQFVETVTDWKQDEKLGFTIKADPKMTPLTTLDEHVTVGGAFFDVMSGTYEIRKANEREVDLVLYSEHRISTHFNFYSRIWSDFLMSEIQQNILKVIKGRAEAEG